MARAAPPSPDRSPGSTPIRRLTCYQIHAQAPRIVPGRSARDWMDATPERYAYRCLPLSIANAMGWEILAPCRVEAQWNGGPELDDLKIAVDDPAWDNGKLASSHFGSGIVTFHLGYLFRTEPGVAILARGAPNWPKDGAAPLEGVIETDWLPFTFTMNWKLTRPGSIAFAAGEPFCFLTPLGYHALDDVVPEIMPVGRDPELQAAFESWSAARRDFNERLRADEPDALRQGWQKWYMSGETLKAERANPAHVSKLALAPPKYSSEDEK